MVSKTFFDFHIHINKGNEKLIKEAERLGFTGIAVVKYWDEYDKNASNDFKRLKEGLEKKGINEDSDTNLISVNNNSINKRKFQIKSAVEIVAKNPEDLKRKVGKFRNKVDILMVNCGGDVKINRAACEDPRVDILLQPYKGRRDSGINHVLAKKAAENSVAIELNLKYLLKTGLRHRFRVLNQFRHIVDLQRKFNFPVIITSDATSIYDLRTPQDLIAIAQCFGMTEYEAEYAISKTPQKIIERAALRNSVVVDGARIIEN